MAEQTAYPGGVIDLRLHRPRERLGLILQALEVLQPGEDLLLVHHEPLQRLPAYIEQHFPGRFELTTVTAGPSHWSVCVHPCD